MTTCIAARTTLAWTTLALLPAVVAAQEKAIKKDVPFVPTPQPVVEEMLRLAEPKEGEVLYDLGCGDGRIVITAAKEYKVKGIGVDIDPARIKESKQNAEEAGVTDRVKFVQKDLFKMDFSDADVLCMYLLTTVNVKLRPIILQDMRPGARVVSHAFSMGDWLPDRELQVKASQNQNVYFWIVPAQIEETSEVMLKTPQGEKPATLRLTQKYQHVTGTAEIGDQELRIKRGTLAGDRLTFAADGHEYSCQVPTKKSARRPKSS